MSVLAYAAPPLTFAERVSALLEKVDYRLIATDEDRDAVYQLRYEAYLREKAITPSFSRRLGDRYDDLDNCWIYGVFVDGQARSASMW